MSWTSPWAKAAGALASAVEGANAVRKTLEAQVDAAMGVADDDAPSSGGGAPQPPAAAIATAAPASPPASPPRALDAAHHMQSQGGTRSRAATVDVVSPRRTLTRCSRRVQQ